MGKPPVVLLAVFLFVCTIYGMLTVVTPPSAEPITTDEMKLVLRVNNSTSSEDSYISSLITAAREFFEDQTGYVCRATTYRQYLEKAPENLRYCNFFYDRFSPPYGSYPVSLAYYSISNLQLWRYPVTSISNITYYDANDTLQTVSSYHSNLVDIPAYVWFDPINNLSINVQPPLYVQYVAGLTTTKDGPKNAIMALVKHWYDNPSAYQEGTLEATPMQFKALIWQYKGQLRI